jgi:hypothetical protein
MPFLLLAAWSRVSTISRSGGTGWSDRMGMFGAAGAEVVMLMVLVSPLWVVALVCTLVAPGLTPRTRVRLALVGPVAFVVTIIAAVWWSPELLRSVVSVAILAATGAGAMRIARDPWRQANA